jgi:transcriptional regulator NrdR family protein
VKCPHCSHEGGKVLETRQGPNGTRRRVRCGGCAQTYALYPNGATLKSALSSTTRALAGLLR